MDNIKSLNNKASSNYIMNNRNFNKDDSYIPLKKEIDNNNYKDNSELIYTTKYKNNRENKKNVSSKNRYILIIINIISIVLLFLMLIRQYINKNKEEEYKNKLNQLEDDLDKVKKEKEYLLKYNNKLYITNSDKNKISNIKIFPEIKNRKLALIFYSLITDPTFYYKYFDKNKLHEKYLKIINSFKKKLNNHSYNTYPSIINYTPEISIIVPIYNEEKYIKRLIKSVKLQSFTNFELILIDDKSTDNTYKIILEEAKKDKRIKVFQNEKNRGILTSRYIGFKYSKGKYITYFNSNDYYSMADSLSLMYYTLIYKNKDIIEYSFIRTKKNKNSNIKISHPFKLKTNTTISDNLFYSYLWMKFIKREVLENAYNLLGDKVNERLIIGDDKIISAAIFLNVKSYFALPIPLYIKKKDKNSVGNVIRSSLGKNKLTLKEEKEVIEVAKILYLIYDIYDENKVRKPYYNAAVDYYLKSGKVAKLTKKYPKIKQAYIDLCNKILNKKNIYTIKDFCNKI